MNLVHYMEELKLQGMISEYQRQSDNPDYLNMSFAERLETLLVVEVEERYNKKLHRLKASSKLRYPTALIEDVNYDHSRNLERSRLRGLADVAWVKRHQPLILTGPTGTGKSWLACALAESACRNGYKSFYTTMADFLEEIELATKSDSLQRIRNKYKKLDLLILDDFGFGIVGLKTSSTVLYIIDAVTANGSLIITSQYPTDVWHQRFRDPTIADAVLDRIVHKAHRFELNGESMRK